MSIRKSLGEAALATTKSRSFGETGLAPKGHARCLASSAWSLAEARVRVAWMVPGGGRRTLLLCARRGDWLGDVQSIGATPRARVGGVASEGFGLRCAQGADGLDLVSVESGTKRLRSE